MSAILFPFLNIANYKFRKGQYHAVLLGFKELYSNHDRYSCYVNIHRISCLILTKNKLAKIEYEYLLEHGQLDLFSREDRKYIVHFLSLLEGSFVISEGELNKLDLSRVSRRTKKYFRI